MMAGLHNRGAPESIIASGDHPRQLLLGRLISIHE